MQPTVYMSDIGMVSLSNILAVRFDDRNGRIHVHLHGMTEPGDERGQAPLAERAFFAGVKRTDRVEFLNLFCDQVRQTLKRLGKPNPFVMLGDNAVLNTDHAFGLFPRNESIVASIGGTSFKLEQGDGLNQDGYRAVKDFNLRYQELISAPPTLKDISF